MPPKFLPAWLVGELLGTFLLVFFGCGSVACTVLYGAQVGIFQVAIIWGLGIALAIHLTASLSGAHLNPAVTIAFAAWKGFPLRRVLPYILIQVTGAFLAAALLFAIYGDALSHFEQQQGIVRGLPGSEASAMIFGEYFPNPGGKPLPLALANAPLWRPFLTETVATAILLLVICGLTDEANRSKTKELTPWAIGLTVTCLISLFGPATMACFNPARDFGPRLFSAFAGWGSVPFTVNGWGWLLVYLIAPILGGWLGAGLYARLLRPAYAAEQ